MARWAAMTEAIKTGARSLFLASDNLRGIFLMIAARIVFAGSDTFTKLASAGLPASEVVFLRNVVSFPVVLFLAWRLGGLGHMAAFRDRLIVTRSVLEGTGTLAFVAALPFVMLGQSTVILLTVPIILVALSALIYREAVGWRRWTAIFVGFVGVVLVAGPFGAHGSYYLLLTQFTAVAWAFRDLLTSRIVGRIPTSTVTLINTIIVGFLAVPGVLLQHWQGFGGQEALYLLGSGGLGDFQFSLYRRAAHRRHRGGGALPLYGRGMGEHRRLPGVGRHSRLAGCHRHTLHHRLGAVHVLPRI
jgi:S-adenosylmethionine uptake transporter